MTQPERLNLDDLPDTLSVREAAEAIRSNPETIRRAIRKGTLAAIAPRGVTNPKAFGTSGYRIHKAELERWYFNLQEAQ